MTYEIDERGTIWLPFNAYSYPEVISTASLYCSEIAAQEQLLKAASRKLVDAYQPTPDFFEAPDNAIGLILAAGLTVEAENTTGKTEARIARELYVAENFSWLLFGDYSVVRPHVGETKVTNLAPNERIALFRRYENPEMSNRLSEWINSSDEIAEVRKELGISPEEANGFIPIVLRAGSAIHMRGIGQAPDSPRIKGKMKKWLANGRRFMEEQGSAEDDVLPYASVNTLEGKNYLCFPEPIAYALLEPDAVGFDNAGGVIDYLKSLIKHEYVHVQTRLEILDSHDDEKGGKIGGLLSEYQAEVFSGYNMDEGYADIYDFVESCEAAGGFSISDVILSHKKGGGADKAAFYFDWINRIGLVPTAMLAGAMTEDDLKYQSTEAGRNLAEVFMEHGLAEELIVRAGWDGVFARYKRLGEEFTQKDNEIWTSRLQRLIES